MIVQVSLLCNVSDSELLTYMQLETIKYSTTGDEMETCQTQKRVIAVVTPIPVYRQHWPMQHRCHLALGQWAPSTSFDWTLKIHGEGGDQL